MKLRSMGRKISSSPIIYEKGGSFCRKCRIGYNFEETVKLLAESKKKKTTGPRCEYCDKLVTTGRSKKSNHVFWDLMKKLERVK